MHQNTFINKYSHLIAVILLLSLPFFAISEENTPPLNMAHWNDPDNDPLMFYGDEEVLSIATGYSQPIAKAPSTASIITAKDIQKIGATTLTEALEGIPGLHVSKAFNGQTPNFVFRGIYTTYTPQVLIMVNSIPINTLFLGNPGLFFGTFPIEAVSRIEVIRGPGSAVYGADAVSGVINIITKNANDIDGQQIGGRLGMFNSYEAWISQGIKTDDYDFSFYLRSVGTDGHNETLEADAQTALDKLQGTNASLTPGPVKMHYRSVDLLTDFIQDKWRVRARALLLRDHGSNIGPARALDVGRWKSDQLSADATWLDKNFSQHTDVQFQLSYHSTTQEVYNDHYQQVFPPGTKLYGPVLPDGLIGNPQYKDRYGRIGFIIDYDAIDQHLLRIGLGYNKGEIYDIFQTRNFGPNPAIGIYSAADCPVSDPLCLLPTTPNSPVFSVTDYPFLIYMDEGAVHNRYLYIQDIWQLANDWELTTGVRADHFSDYGSTYNPRLALVWAAKVNLNVKLLYGQAFRSPNFGETRSKNNPATLGNMDLQPETIETVELAFDYAPFQGPAWQFGIFHYDWDSIIQTTPTGVGSQVKFQNAGRQVGYGFELAMEWKPSNTLSLRSNLAMQQSTNVNSGTAAGNAPHWQFYVRSDWEFQPQWNLDTQINRVSDRRRAPAIGETREPLNGFTTVDITLRYTSNNHAWEVATSVHNLFDEQVKEPSTVAAALPYDMPMAGRSAYVEGRYNF